MNKAYSRTYWENYPSDNSPINERNLNNIEVGVNEIDNRVITLDTTKMNKTDAANMVKNITYNHSNGIFTIIYFNGATATIDTNLEKLAVNFAYDKELEKLIIYLEDGTTQEVDLSALITQYDFLDSDMIAFQLDGTGNVSAIVKDGSITEDKLQPNYLADIKVEVAKTETNASIAEKCANEAKISAEKAEQCAEAAGWADFDIDDKGHLIFTKTDNLETEFALTDSGRLEVTLV